MSGTQPTMADAHPPGAQVFKLPSYCMPLPVDPPRSDHDSEPSSDEEGKDDKRMRWHKSRSPVSPFEHGPPSPVSPRYAQKMDKDDSEDDKPLKRPESPIKKPTPLKPTPLKGPEPLPPSMRQFSCKLDTEGVWRYKPEPGDYKPKSQHVEPYPTPSQLKKREAPEEWPEDEDKCEDEAKLTWAPKKKVKKDKAKAKGKAGAKAANRWHARAAKGLIRNSQEEADTSPLTWGPAYGSLPKEDKSKKDKAKKDKANAMSLSSYKGDIDENSSVVEVGKWVLHMNGLGWCGIDCSDIFEEHNINGSDLLQMTEEAINKLGLDIDDREIILSRIKTLQAKSKTKRSLDKAMDEV